MDPFVNGVASVSVKVIVPLKVMLFAEDSETYSIGVRGKPPASGARDEALRAILVRVGVPLGALDETVTVTAAPAPLVASGNVIDCAATPALVSAGICTVVGPLVDSVVVTDALELAGLADGVACGRLETVPPPPHAMSAVATMIDAPDVYVLIPAALRASDGKPPNMGLTRKGAGAESPASPLP